MRPGRISKGCAAETGRRSHASRPAGAAEVALCLAFSAVGGPAHSTEDSSAATRLAGRRLSDALRLLQDQGWPVVFSSRLVRDTMRVVVEPAGADRRALLADLVRPHGLEVRDGARDRLVIVAAARPSETAYPRTSGQAPAPERAGPAASVREEIVVTPTRDPRDGSSIEPLHLDPDQIEEIPCLADDAFSLAGVVPGMVSTEGSTPLNVRGGGTGEVAVLLDGFELVTPYHLGEFDGAVSVVTPSSVEHADLFTGAYPAQYGNATSGVADLTTRMPTRGRHFSLGLDVLHAEGAASGTLGDLSRWFAAGRSGSYQWPLEFSGRDEHPRYWDAFGKFELELGKRQTLAGHLLVANDRFELSSEHRGEESYSSEWDSQYAWIRHGAVLGRDVYGETLIGRGRVSRDRGGSLTSSGGPVSAIEQRHLAFADVKQDWHWEAGPKIALKWGVDVERSDTTLDFRTDRDLAGELPPPLENPLVQVDGRFDRRFDSTHAAAYGSTQLHPWRGLSLELGLRHETVILSDESHLSSRVSPPPGDGPRSVVRAAWGWFYRATVLS